jgi:hypothetical protein
MSFGFRFGQFLVLLGFIGLIIFMASDQARQPRYEYFCLSFIFIIGGVYLIWRFRQPPPKADRFRRFRGNREDESDGGGPE